MRVIGIVQARMGSARLPGKVLLPMAGAPMLQRLIERVTRSRRLDAVVVATSRATENSAIETLCRRLEIPAVRGSEADVLERMLQAAESRDADIIVRLTGDNPLVDGALIDDLLDAFLPGIPPLVYAQNVDGSGFPNGLSLEAITTGALRTTAAASKDPLDREHVTRYVRQRHEIFPTLLFRAAEPVEGVSVTIDTEADYTRVRALFERLYRRDPAFTYRDVMRAIASTEVAEVS